jgi:hypothetical protein
VIGVAGLVIALIGVIIAFLSWRGDERERASPAGSAGVAGNGPRVTESSPAGVVRGPDGYPVFDLTMRGGHAYDIDVQPGRAPTVNGGLRR